MSGPPDYVTPFAQAAELPHPDMGGAFIQGMQQNLAQQVQRAQLSRQLSQQQQLDAARQDFISNPTPESVRALAALDPQGFAAIKDAHAQQSTDQQKQDLKDSAAVAGYLRADRPDDALAIAQQRRDAMKAAGQDSSSMDHLISAIQSDPKAALGMMNYGLAAILGPDKFGEAFPALEGNARAAAEEPGKIALTAAQTAEAQAAAAKTQVETTQLTNPRPETAATSDAYGNPVFYDKNAAPPVTEPPKDFTNLAAAIEADENATGDSSARPTDPKTGKPLSSAMGNGQFINSTWLQTVKSARPDLAKGKTDAQILAMRRDPAISREITAANAQINAGALEVARQPVNGATLAMAHKLGPADADKVLSAPQDTPLKTILSPKVLVANPQLAKMTAGQYYGGLIQKFGANPISGTADGQPGQLSGDGLEYVAQQYVSTGTLPPLGNGKMATMNRDAIISRAAQIEKETGSTGYDAVARHNTIKAAAGALSKVTQLKGLIESSEETVSRNMDLVKGLAPKGAGPTGSPILNMPIQHLRKDVWGSVDVANFDAAVGTVADEYAKVMSSNTGSGGVTSDSARKEAYARLGKAQTLDQLTSVMNTMKKEMANRSGALASQQDQLQATIRNKGVAPAQTASADNLPTLSPQQAAQLPKGARFRTTDGRVLVRQ